MVATGSGYQMRSGSSRKNDRAWKLRRHAIPPANVELLADILVPPGAVGSVLFAHGSGNSRRSPRNRYVSETLHDGGSATILTDLLTPEEERIDARTSELRFDIPLLAQCLIGVADWASREPILGNLGLGGFGARTGPAAALIAAAEQPRIVCRQGRPSRSRRNRTSRPPRA